MVAELVYNQKHRSMELLNTTAKQRQEGEAVVNLFRLLLLGWSPSLHHTVGFHNSY